MPSGRAQSCDLLSCGVMLSDLVLCRKQFRLHLISHKSDHGQVTPGSANEAVTAVLPLYINASHWSVAREKMKPILGWTCTLNVLGFSYQQVVLCSPYLSDHCETVLQDVHMLFLLMDGAANINTSARNGMQALLRAS